LIQRLVNVQQRHAAASQGGRFLELFAYNNEFYETV